MHQTGFHAKLPGVTSSPCPSRPGSPMPPSRYGSLGAVHRAQRTVSIGPWQFPWTELHCSNPSHHLLPQLLPTQGFFFLLPFHTWLPYISGARGTHKHTVVVGTPDKTKAGDPARASGLASDAAPYMNEPVPRRTGGEVSPSAAVQPVSGIKGSGVEMAVGVEVGGHGWHCPRESPRTSVPPLGC